MFKKFFILLLLISQINLYAEKPKRIQIIPETVKASSFLFENENYIFNPARISDNNISTSYVEGAIGNGLGTTVDFSFNDTVWLSEIQIANGFGETVEGYKENGRVKKFKITIFKDGLITHQELYELKDIHDIQSLLGKSTFFADRVLFEIIDSYSGEKFDDVAISEIIFFGEVTSNYKMAGSTADGMDLRKSRELFLRLQNLTIWYGIRAYGGVVFSFSGNTYKFKYTYAPVPFGVVEGRFSIINDIIYLYPYRYLNDSLLENPSLLEKSNLIEVENPLELTVAKVEFSDKNIVKFDFIEYDSFYTAGINELLLFLSMIGSESRPELRTSILPFKIQK